MPRTKLQDKFCVPPTDHIKGLILSAAHNQKKTNAELAEMAGVGKTAYNEMMNKPSSQWPLCRILGLCEGLRIPIEDLRPAIRY